MLNFINKHKYQLLLWLFILAYIAYFSYYTVLRYQTLYASYFDLGIMHQTVFNTYRAMTTGDWSRFLELTDPFGQGQIKRMAIHNDILLAPLALFYFLYSSPATLLVIQAIVLGLGAWFVFKIAQHVLKKLKQVELISLLFAVSYLLYPPLERANMYEFHAVTLATTFLLAMFYLWLKKRYIWSFIFLALSAISKEEIGMMTFFFGGFILWNLLRGHLTGKKELFFSLSVMIISLGWFILSIFYIIPTFRGGIHFALSYYSDFGDTPAKVLFGVVTNPQTIIRYVADQSAINYLVSLLGPLGFLSFLSPLRLLIALPELAINLLSNNPSLRNIYFQYSSGITPFVFISAIYGAAFLTNKFKWQKNYLVGIICTWLIVFILFFAYREGPLPGAKKQEIHPFLYPQKERAVAARLAYFLRNESIKVSTTGHLAPLFTSRRYFYNFSQFYYLADYVVIQPYEVYNSLDRKSLIPAYRQLQKDKRFKLVYDEQNFELYKKIWFR